MSVNIERGMKWRRRDPIVASIHAIPGRLRSGFTMTGATRAFAQKIAWSQLINHRMPKTKNQIFNFKSSTD
jgi:hypothetical protein